MNRTDCDTLVVGAGIAGLAHAFWRRHAGQRVLVAETSARAGGVIETVHKDGYRFEWAATSVRSNATHVGALLEALDDAPTLHDADAAGVQLLLMKNGLHRMPRSPGALMRCSMLSLGQRLRVMAEPFIPRRRLGRAHHAETLANFITRRFGRGITESFLRPFTSGIYGAAPERLGAADAFPTLTAMEQRHGSVLKGLIKGAKAARSKDGGKPGIRLFDGGMQRFPQALADALGDDVWFDTTVTSLTPGGPERPAIATLADGREVAAREIVLAMPTRAQAALLRPHASAVADQLEAVPYVPIAVAAVGFRRADGPTLPDAFGFLRGRGGAARILGATFSSKLSPDVAPAGCELITVYFGGSEDPEFVSATESTIRSEILRDLGTALGGRIRPALFEIARHPRAIPLFAPGHRGRMAALQGRLAGMRIRLSGAHITGVAVDQCCAPLAPLRGPMPAGVTLA